MAEIVIDEKEKNPNINLPVQYRAQTLRENGNKKLYQYILDKNDEVNILGEHYFRSCYQYRNCWMVNNSSLVIAVYNGAKGGAQNTIKHTKEKI